VYLPLLFGSEVHHFKVHILPDKVDGKDNYLPLLLGLEDIQRVGLVIDCGKEVRLKTTGELLPFVIDEKHLTSDANVSESTAAVVNTTTTFNCTTLSEAGHTVKSDFRNGTRRARVLSAKDGNLFTAMCHAAGLEEFGGEITVVDRSNPSSTIKIQGEPAELLFLGLTEDMCTKKFVKLVGGEVEAAALDPSGKFDLFVFLKLIQEVNPDIAATECKQVCQVTISDETLGSIRNLHAGCKIPICRTCAIERRRRDFLHKIPSCYKTTKSGERVAVDIVGPVAKSFSGKSYAIVFVDMFDGRVLA